MIREAIRDLTDLKITSAIHGGEVLRVWLDGRMYEHRFRFPHNLSLDVALEPLSERVNDHDYRTNSGVRCATHEGGLYFWNRLPERTTPLDIVIETELINYQLHPSL